MGHLPNRAQAPLAASVVAACMLAFPVVAAADEQVGAPAADSPGAGSSPSDPVGSILHNVSSALGSIQGNLIPGSRTSGGPNASLPGLPVVIFGNGRETDAPAARTGSRAARPAAVEVAAPPVPAAPAPAAPVPAAAITPVPAAPVPAPAAPAEPPVTAAAAPAPPNATQTWLEQWMPWNVFNGDCSCTHEEPPPPPPPPPPPDDEDDEDDDGLGFPIFVPGVPGPPRVNNVYCPPAVPLVTPPVVPPVVTPPVVTPPVVTPPVVPPGGGGVPPAGGGGVPGAGAPAEALVYSPASYGGGLTFLTGIGREPQATSNAIGLAAVFLLIAMGIMQWRRHGHRSKGRDRRAVSGRADRV